MRQTHRVQRMYEILQDKQNASTQYLSTVLDISESTVRRDIDLLLSLYSDVRRVHGGVVMANPREDSELMFELKLNQNHDLKKRLARAVVELVADGQSLILDSGTTCLYAAMELHRKRGLRVVTTDVKIADELGHYEGIQSLIAGGTIRPGYYTVGDSMAVEMLGHFSVDRTIMSADAVDTQTGVTNVSVFEVGVKKKIMECARESILVADHTKFGHTAFYRIAGLNRFSKIITTRELDARIAEQITELGVRLLLI